MSHKIKSHLLLLKWVQAMSIEYRGYTSHHKQNTGVGRATEKTKQKQTSLSSVGLCPVIFYKVHRIRMKAKIHLQKTVQWRIF